MIEAWCPQLRSPRWLRDGQNQTHSRRIGGSDRQWKVAGEIHTKHSDPGVTGPPATFALSEAAKVDLFDLHWKDIYRYADRREATLTHFLTDWVESSTSSGSTRTNPSAAPGATPRS